MEEVQAASGWPLRVAAAVEESVRPTAWELAALRDLERAGRMNPKHAFGDLTRGKRAYPHPSDAQKSHPKVRFVVVALLCHRNERSIAARTSQLSSESFSAVGLVSAISNLASSSSHDLFTLLNGDTGLA